MGGYLSGRRGGRPIADGALTIDFAWMLRTRKAVPDALVRGSLLWTYRGEQNAGINYRSDMRDLDDAWLELHFNTIDRSTGEKRDCTQRVPLSFTVPHFGGRRWWMHCPLNGSRVGKLYCPQGGDIFASRTAWRLGYRSQRVSDRYKPFERLFALQKRLGCKEAWLEPIERPKGMWRRTFDRHLKQYQELDRLCNIQTMIVSGDHHPR